MDGDACQVAIASLKLCFNCNGNDQSRGWIDSGGDCDDWKAMVAAFAAMQSKLWRAGVADDGGEWVDMV